MARARTLLQLRTRIREEADCTDSGTRHSSTFINTCISESWQALREMVTEAGDLTYVANTSTSTGVGPDTGKAYGLLPMPATACRIHAIDLTIPGRARPKSLTPVSFNERNEFGTDNLVTGTPHSFAVFNIGAESGASVGNGWIALLPAPNVVYPATIYYLPSWTDITNDAHVFDGFAGWDDWVCWDVVCKIATKDSDMQQVYQMADNERTAARARVISAASSIQRVGSTGGVDTAAMRRRERVPSPWREPR